MSNMKTFEELKAEAKERGIVEGAVIKTATTNDYIETLGDSSQWSSHNGSLWSADGICLYEYEVDSWATVITPAPSTEEGLKEGDAVECGPAMRAAIVELAKELGICDSHGGYEGSDMKGVWNIWGKGLVYMVSDFGGLTKITPEAFIAKMRVTAALPKPEPPIMIGSDKVEFRAGRIKVGCTTIDNATVRAIASKLIGE